MSFIKSKYVNINKFCTDYINNLNLALSKINEKKLNEICNTIERAIKRKSTIYVCGNGGSAAISNHYVCDFLKYMRTDNNLSPKIISLSNSVELVTAIGNDISFDEIFSYQLNSLGNKKDILITISSSGNSKNIINALKLAKKKGIISISFTGFKGGYSKKIATNNLHFNIHNYGLSEDSHHISMHIICQFIRQKYIRKNLKKIKF